MLAAGQASRMGCNKALLPFRGLTLLHNLIVILQRADCSPVFVVVGGVHELAIVDAVGSMPGVVVVRNPQSKRGMMSSLQVGLARAAMERTRYTIFTPVDLPLSSAEAVAAVLDAADAHRTAPHYDARSGHPVRLSALAVQSVLAAPVDCSPREVLSRWKTQRVPVNDRGVTANINTPEDMHQWLGEDQ